MSDEQFSPMMLCGGDEQVPLKRGRDLGFDFSRTAYKFTMFNQGKEVRFVISSEAL
jgi:hypothetical protein